MSHYSGRWRLGLAVGAGALGMAFAGCGAPSATRPSTGPPGRQRSVQAAGPGWAAYFFPAVVGERCTLVERPVVTTVAGNTIKSTGSMTDTVVAVHPTTRSVVYAIRSRTHVSTSQTNPPPGFPAIGPTNRTYSVNPGPPPGLLQPQGSEQDGACRAVSSGAVLR